MIIVQVLTSLLSYIGCKLRALKPINKFSMVSAQALSFHWVCHLIRMHKPHDGAEAGNNNDNVLLLHHLHLCSLSSTCKWLSSHWSRMWYRMFSHHFCWGYPVDLIFPPTPALSVLSRSPLCLNLLPPCRSARVKDRHGTTAPWRQGERGWLLTLKIWSSATSPTECHASQVVNHLTKHKSGPQNFGIIFTHNSKQFLQAFVQANITKCTNVLCLNCCEACCNLLWTTMYSTVCIVLTGIVLIACTSLFSWHDLCYLWFQKKAVTWTSWMTSWSVCLSSHATTLFVRWPPCPTPATSTMDPVLFPGIGELKTFKL